MKPVVIHLIRKFLLPRETFVGNQINGLTTYQPIVGCHEIVANPSFQIDDVYSSLDRLDGWGRLGSRAAYFLFRHLTRAEIDFFHELVSSRGAVLLHIHFCVDARYFIDLVRSSKLRTVVSAYGYDISQFPRRYFGLGKKYLKPIFDRADRFLAMSEDMKNDLISIGCPKDKITVHYHGVDVERFSYPQREYPDRGYVNILLCGNLEVKKAQHIVLRALRLLAVRNRIRDNFRVDIVGDGPLKKKLVGLVNDYGWRDRVAFHGYVPYGSDRLLEFYRAADIFLLPSITVHHDKEGIPGTIVEAMASGLPVISTYHAGIPEIIDHDRHGILVKENDLEDLAAALERTINDRALRERLGRAAAERANLNYNFKAKARDLEKIYDALIG